MRDLASALSIFGQFYLIYGGVKMDEKTIIMKEFLRQVRTNKLLTTIVVGFGVGLYFVYKKVDELEKKFEGVTTERD